MSGILIIDFGSQVMQLIARRVRESKVHSVISSPAKAMEEIRKFKPGGIILSGSPDSVYSSTSRTISSEIFNLDIPILGICYGQQITCTNFGGRVEATNKREFGRANLNITKQNDLIKEEGTV